MKKAIVILFTCLTFFNLCSTAQVNISSSDLPKSGDKDLYISGAVDTINVAKTGAGYSWDFSYLKPSVNNVLHFEDPTKISLLYLTYYGDVTDTSLGGALAGLGFYKNSKSSYKKDALLFTVPVVNLQVPVPYSNSDVEYNLPVKYGNSDDSCAYNGSISIPNVGGIKITGTRHNSIDGYGTVKTPFGTFNCVRVKSVIKETDSVFINLPADRIEYKWLASGEKIPVMEVVVSAGGLIKQIYYKDSARNIKSPLAPPVNFTANDTVVYIGDTVKFTNQTTDILGIYSYAWTFSPGTLSFVDSTSNKVREPHVTFSDTGFYSVTLDVTIPVVNIKGTRAKNNYIWVRALGKPVADFYADRLSPSVTNTVHFTDNSSNGPNQWLWLFSPNTITYMNGSNSTSQNPDVRFDSTGKYTVTLLASNRIGAGTVTKTDYITVSKSAGIESMEELSSLIKIYPNPSGTIFHISTDKLTDDKISAIEVVDLTGRKIFYIRSSMVKSIFDLDLGMFPKGNYMIKFIGKDGVYTRMLLKD